MTQEPGGGGINLTYKVKETGVVLMHGSRAW